MFKQHRKILIATGNQGKYKEFAEFFKEYDLECVNTNSFTIKEPEETGADFTANAELKAKYYAEQTGLPALADDSGLAVTELSGQPGIYSARWAGPEKDFKLAMQKIENLLKEKQINFDQVTGKFICSLCFYVDKNEYYSCSGEVYGKIIFPARGSNGFGYDPIFIPENESLTFAEMAQDVKAKYSHRARALKKLKKMLKPVA